jgi:hypothetical protein
MQKGTFTVRADEAKQRLYVRVEGYLSEAETQALADDIIAQAGKLKAGFCVITDLSQAQPFSEAGAQKLERAQSFLQQHGLRRLIRVFDPRNILSKMQFERKGRDAGYTVEQESARSLAEAEKMLDTDS